MACSDPWGAGPSVIIEICKALEIENVRECLYKVIHLVSESQEEVSIKGK